MIVQAFEPSQSQKSTYVLFNVFYGKDTRKIEKALMPSHPKVAMGIAKLSLLGSSISIENGKKNVINRMYPSMIAFFLLISIQISLLFLYYAQTAWKVCILQSLLLNE